MDSQLKIYSDNLSNLTEYPIWSFKRHLYIIEYRKFIKDFDTSPKRLLRDLWRKRTCVCECGFTTTNQNLQHHKSSKKHFKLLNNTPTNPDKVICECGGKYIRKNITQHYNTKKHLLFHKNKE